MLTTASPVVVESFVSAFLSTTVKREGSHSYWDRFDLSSHCRRSNPVVIALLFSFLLLLLVYLYLQEGAPAGGGGGACEGYCEKELQEARLQKRVLGSTTAPSSIKDYYST